jgi:hypothetical protein
VTLQGSIDKIKASVQWIANNGDVAVVLKKWIASNWGEATKIAQFALDRLSKKSVPMPTLSTKLGQGSAEILDFAIPNVVDPPPPPPPAPKPPTIFATKGAFVTVAGNFDPAWGKEAGLKAIAPQITSLGMDNDSTFRNVNEFELGWWNQHSYAARFAWGTHGGDFDREVAHVRERVEKYKIVGYLADTERLWLNQMPQLADILLAKLLAALTPLGCKVATVSFGYSPDSPGQLWNSGYSYNLKYGAPFVPEAYKFSGETYGINTVMSYLTKEGIEIPALMGIGQVVAQSDIDDCRALVNLGKINGVWLWSADQAGPATAKLKAIPL